MVCIDKKARISVTVCKELNTHEMMDSVSRAAVRAHEIIANCYQAINGWRSLTLDFKASAFRMFGISW